MPLWWAGATIQHAFVAGTGKGRELGWGKGSQSPGLRDHRRLGTPEALNAVPGGKEQHEDRV